MNTFDAAEQQLPCLAHSTGLGTNDFIETVTQTALLESQEAIWNYDPEDPSNERGGELDAIAIIRTLALKIQVSLQRVNLFELFQTFCGFSQPRKIPLHSKTPWGSAAKMCAHGYELRKPIDIGKHSSFQRQDGNVPRTVALSWRYVLGIYYRSEIRLYSFIM